MSYKHKLKDIMFEYTRTLQEKDYMKSEITVREILDTIEEVMAYPNVNFICHEYLCEKCKKEN